MQLGNRNGHEWYDVHPLVRELPAFQQLAARHAQVGKDGRQQLLGPYVVTGKSPL